MPASDVIADTSRTLQSVLQTSLGEEWKRVTVTVGSPCEDLGPGVRLNLHLFRVAEDPAVRNFGLPTRGAGGEQVRKPAMALRLLYLVTAFGQDALEEQRLLGRAIQVLYEQSVLAGPDLQGALAEAAAEGAMPRVTQLDLTLEELDRVWGPGGLRRRASSAYAVGPAFLKG